MLKHYARCCFLKRLSHCNLTSFSMVRQVSSQKKREKKEYRKWQKQQEIEENIKYAMETIKPYEQKDVTFDECDYTEATAPGNKKDTSVPMPGKYSSVYVEACWYSWWEKMGYFSSIQRNKQGLVRDPRHFSMVIPPPNVTGKLHLGHALTTAIEDTLVRWKIMCGHDVLWVPGSDHAGIATQAVVERQIGLETGETRDDLGTKKFKEAIWKWKENKGSDIYHQLRKLGASLDWEKSVFTLDKHYYNAVEEAFIRLFNAGDIYRDETCINWCCKLQTTLSDIEVESRVLTEPTLINVPDHNAPVQFGMLHKFAYKLVTPVDDVDEIVVATTRPETIFGDEAVAVHPEDSRYSSLVGRKLRHPLFYNKQIPIIADEAVDMSMGTGALKVTPAHDFTDFEIGRRHNLPVVPVIDKEGKIIYNEQELPPRIGKLLKRQSIHGASRHAVREIMNFILSRLKLSRGSQFQPSTLRLCSRSGDVIEPMVMEQWFLRLGEMNKMALDAVESGKINFLQKSRFEKQWHNWLTSTKDWCLSRQICWGHRVPAFKCNNVITGDYVWVAARTATDATKQALAKLPEATAGSIDVQQDPDVLDTWFSSALYPFASLGWPNETEALEKYYPLSLMETGSDLIFFWVARMIMLGIRLTGQVPFRNVLFHPMVRDKHNRKMSKSVGNVIDPLHIIDGATMKERVEELKGFKLNSETTRESVHSMFSLNHGVVPSCGSDALKLSLCSHNTNVDSILFNLENAFIARRFCNKVWNVYYLIMKNCSNPLIREKLLSARSDPSVFVKRFQYPDLWINSRFAHVVEECNAALEAFDVTKALQTVKNFILDDLSGLYWEHNKEGILKIFDETDDDAVDDEYTFAVEWNKLRIGEAVLRLLCPFAPFLCEELWQRLPKDLLDMNPKDSVCISPYPEACTNSNDKNPTLEKGMSVVISLNKVISKNIVTYLLPKSFGVVYCCKHDSDKQLLDQYGSFTKTMFGRKVTSVEVYPFSKLSELKRQCLGVEDEKADINIFYKLTDETFREYVQKEDYVSSIEGAKDLWINKIEKLERKLAKHPSRKAGIISKMIRISESYLVLKKWKDVCDRFKSN